MGTPPSNTIRIQMRPRTECHGISPRERVLWVARWEHIGLLNNSSFQLGLCLLTHKDWLTMIVGAQQRLSALYQWDPQRAASPVPPTALNREPFPALLPHSILVPTRAFNRHVHSTNSHHLHRLLKHGNISHDQLLNSQQQPADQKPLIS